MPKLPSEFLEECWQKLWQMVEKMLWRAAKGECLWRAAKANASGCNKKRLLAAEGECLWRAAKANAFGGLGFRVQGFRVQGLGFAGSGFRVAEVFHSWVRLGGGSSWDLRVCPAQAPPSEFLEGKSELGVGKSELRVGKSELRVGKSELGVGKERYFRFLGTVS